MKKEIQTITVKQLTDALSKYDDDTQIFFVRQNDGSEEVIAMCDSYLKPVRMRDFDDVDGSRLGVLNSQNGYLDEFRGKAVIIDVDGVSIDEDWTNNVD